MSKTQRMPRILAVAAALGLVCVAAASAQTSVSGTIASDTTWQLSQSPIAVTGNVAVAAGVTLTIQPGVVVQFAQGKALQVNGTLIAHAEVVVINDKFGIRITDVISASDRIKKLNEVS